ncbi:MAG TPA: hypothetical protein VFW25_01430 [Silvibacterium sp.]|nr:hypothetical protein [Silvibacterium sp.]
MSLASSVGIRFRGPSHIIMGAIVALMAFIFTSQVYANSFSSTAFLQSSQPAAFELFGISVAADGNLLAVGATNDFVGPGSVYIFKLVPGTNGGHPSWVLQATLHAPDGFTNDQFGRSVAIQGNTLVAAAPNAMGTGGQTGAAYVFVNTNGTWTLQAKLSPQDTNHEIGFGFGASPICISGNTIAVGAPDAPDSFAPVLQQGAVYVFTNDGGVWKQQAHIVPDDPQVAELGFDLSLQNDTLLIGAPGSSVGGLSEVGAAFIYTRVDGGWTQQANLQPPIVAQDAFFGTGVSLDRSTAAVGAPGIGTASVFSENNGPWALQQQITGPVLNSDSDFATNLKVIGDVLLIGAYEDFRSSDELQTGTAFVYRQGGSTWTEQSDLRMAPEQNGLPGPGVANQRFANLVTMTHIGSTTLFVLGSPGLSNPALREGSVGGVYTTILN